MMLVGTNTGFDIVIPINAAQERIIGVLDMPFDEHRTRLHAPTNQSVRLPRRL